MKISELQPRQGKVEIEAEVIDKGEVRTFEKFGKEGRVCNAKIKDDSGEMTLSLWNEQSFVADLFKRCFYRYDNKSTILSAI